MQFNDNTYWDMVSMDTLPILSVEAIAHALSHICRYGGHTDCLYSVAQHCCAVAALAKPEHRKEALLHDASEAYLGDIPAPMKWRNPELKRFEEGIQRSIFEHYGLRWPIPEDVEFYDKAITYTEMFTFFSSINPEIEVAVKERCGDEIYLIPELQSCWTSHYAKQKFITDWYDADSSLRREGVKGDEPVYWDLESRLLGGSKINE